MWKENIDMGLGIENMASNDNVSMERIIHHPKTFLIDSPLGLETWRLYENWGSSSDLGNEEHIIDVVLESILLPLRKTRGFQIGIWIETHHWT